MLKMKQGCRVKKQVPPKRSINKRGLRREENRKKIKVSRSPDLAFSCPELRKEGTPARRIC